MMRCNVAGAIVSCAAILGASPLRAQVGEPTGTFGIKIMHGTTVVVNNPAVTVPLDHKLSDHDPEDFVQIGTIGPMSEPIILKLVTEDDPNFRISHWYIDVPHDLLAINIPGTTSLFGPGDPSPISVAIIGLAFTGTTAVTPLVVNNNTYATAFMRDMGGVFYNLPQGLLFPGFPPQVQAPGAAFLDGFATPYSFAGTFSLPTASWIWSDIPNPGPFTTTNNGVNPFAPSIGGGYVFELGLGVSFVGIPEPATLALLAPGLFLIFRRRARP